MQSVTAEGIPPAASTRFRSPSPVSISSRTRPPSTTTAVTFVRSCTTHRPPPAAPTHAASCLGRSVMPRTPRQRGWPAWAVAAPSDPSRVKPRHHSTTAPAAWTSATIPPKARPRTVKNWAPWSQTADPIRRVAILPPTPRPLSTTSTRLPAATSSCAADRPAIPAPTTTASHSLGLLTLPQLHNWNGSRVSRRGLENALSTRVINHEPD